MLLFRATYIAFKVYGLLIHAFPGNQTLDFGIVNTMLVCLSWYFNAALFSRDLKIRMFYSSYVQLCIKMS